MRIGVFDSGLGGLAIAQAIIRRLPQYDYLYLGDTKRVPYGGRSQATIQEFTTEAIGYLFQQDCQIVILACNTASAEALRKSQQDYLPIHHPDRRVLGVIIPTVEEVVKVEGAKRVGVLATRSTVDSGSYVREITCRRPDMEVVQVAAPLLVPLVENQGLGYVAPILDDYLKLLGPVDCLVLGCTHYALLKDLVRQRVAVPVLSADEIVPDKLADYLSRHPEHESKLGRRGSRRFEVTDLGPGYESMVQSLAGELLKLELVSL